MNTRTAICGALLALAALTGCSSDTKADPAACKAAMEKQFADAMKSGKEGSRPAECDGVDDKTIQKYAADIIGDQTSKELEKSLDDLDKDIDDTLSNLETATP